MCICELEIFNLCFFIVVELWKILVTPILFNVNDGRVGKWMTSCWEDFYNVKEKKGKLTSDVWKSFDLLPQKPNAPLYCVCKNMVQDIR